MATGRILLLGMLLLLLAACKTELPLPSLPGQKCIALVGELIAGDTMSIRAGYSLPVTTGAVMRFETPTGLSIGVTDGVGNAYNLTGNYDEWTPSLNTLRYSGPFLVGTGRSYVFNAKRASLPDASCAIDIPLPLEAEIIDTVAVPYAGTQALQVRVHIKDRAGETNRYVFEAVKQTMVVDGFFQYNGTTYSYTIYRAFYESLKASGQAPEVKMDTAYRAEYTRLGLYTNDTATENLKIGSALLTNRRVLLSDTSFQGGDHTMTVFVDKQNFASSDNNSKGRVLFWIKSVPDAYFRYLRAYETFSPSTGLGSLSQPIQLTGNVLGGYGVIGSAYRVQYAYLFDRWTF